MSQDDAPLTDAERAELEQLRAEKAEREEHERIRRERAELERLRAERTATSDAPTTRKDEADAIARERARRLMEPGDDLSMPPAQKIVLGGLVVVVIAILAMYFLGPR